MINKNDLFKSKSFYIALICIGVCLYLCIAYFLKSSVEKAELFISSSPKTAIKILEKAIQKNDTEAAIYLANIYWDKTYSLQNYNKATHLYLSLPEEEKEKNSSIQEKLGQAYEKGLGVEKNEEEALKWYTKAFNNGKQDIAFYLAEAYEKGENFKQDKQKEFYWLSKTIEVDENNANALYNIGNAYFKGDVVKKDKKKAFDFFVKAADNGHIPAAEYVGKAYYTGKEIKKDEDLAVKYLTLVGDSEKADNEVLYMLAKYYYTKDKSKSINYAKKYFNKFSPKQIADFFLNFKLIDSTSGEISTFAEIVQNVYYGLNKQYRNNLDYINMARINLGLVPYRRLKSLQPRIWSVKYPYRGENREEISLRESTQYSFFNDVPDLYEDKDWSFIVDLQRNKILSGNGFGNQYNPIVNFCNYRNAVITKRSEKSIHETECYFPITDEDILEYLFGFKTTTQQKAAKVILNTYFN